VAGRGLLSTSATSFLLTDGSRVVPWIIKAHYFILRESEAVFCKTEYVGEPQVGWPETGGQRRG
jgi:hypothetical protein